MPKICDWLITAFFHFFGNNLLSKTTMEKKEEKEDRISASTRIRHFLTRESLSISRVFARDPTSRSTDRPIDRRTDGQTNCERPESAIYRLYITYTRGSRTNSNLGDAVSSA